MKRWPVIRHIRWWWLSIQVHKWARMWAKHGIGLGYPNPSDLRYLKDVWEGKQ